MANLLIALVVVSSLILQVTSTPLEPGGTLEFDYDHDKYWVFIDWWGTVDYQKAVDSCKTLHDAEVTTIVDEVQYEKIQTEVEGAIPATWHEVLLWTSDSTSSGTKELLVIWRPGTGVPSRKEAQPTDLPIGDGYVCRKRSNTPGTTYNFNYDHDEYWFNIDWWGTYNFATSESKCAEHDATVVEIVDQAQRDEIEKYVEDRIPLTWREVMLWTANSKKAGTNEMMVIYRPGTGGPNSISDQAPSYKGHGYVCMKQVNEPGTTYSYVFDGVTYFIMIDWWGTIDYADAQAACATHRAVVASTTNDAVYAEMQKQVEYRIPLTWHEVLLWTSDSTSCGTHEIIVVWREGTGGPNTKGSYKDSYAGHGYVCSKV